MEYGNYCSIRNLWDVFRNVHFIVKVNTLQIYLRKAGEYTWQNLPVKNINSLNKTL